MHKEDREDVRQAIELVKNSGYRVVRKLETIQSLKKYRASKPDPKIGFGTFKTRLRNKGMLSNRYDYDIDALLDPELWIKRVTFKQSKTIESILSFTDQENA